jgi:hypothetical protein
VNDIQWQLESSFLDHERAVFRLDHDVATGRNTFLNILGAQSGVKELS